MPSASIRALLTRFARDERGNIAVLFAIALLPILGFVGAAIDYSRAAAAKTSMQGALDSAALMIAKDLSSNTIKASDVATKGPGYFTGLYAYAGAENIQVTASYTAAASGSKGSTVLMTASGDVKSDFMQMFGFPTLGFNTSSTATWGNSLLRVALVLDNTGSMAQYNKLSSLKTAAQNFVTQLSGLATNTGDVMISVVPFSTDVNVGTSNSGATWLRWDLWDPANTNSHGQSYCSGGSSFTMAMCTGHHYTWNHNPGSPATSQWNGCVTDRDQSYDVSSTAPGSLVTQFPADQAIGCPTKMVPLTTNWTTVNNTITAMTAQGSTNQTVGLQWGWLSLLQQSPLNAPSEDPNNVYQHIIVLFTDGLNTADRWYGDGSTTSTQVDTRMKLLCDAVKASGAVIYTVQIDTDGAGQSPVLPYCASGGSNFFMLTQASQINSAFTQIATQISKLRVSK